MAERSLRETLKGLLPDVLFELGPDAKALLRDPQNFIRGVLFNTVLMFIGNFLFQTVAIIEQATNAVIRPLVAVRIDLTGALSLAGNAALDAVASFNGAIAGTAANTLGVGAFPVLVTLAVLELALVYRAGVALLPALTDAAGAVPVLGSVLDGVSTFVLGLVEGGDDG